MNPQKLFRGKNFSFALKERSLIMGILNVTPDSFSDGGEAFLFEDALKKAEKLQSDGADILDIGAGSTAPLSPKTDALTELSRLEKTLPAIISNARVPVSVDTFFPQVARFALENGASIINDVGGKFDYETAALVKRFDAGWIITHAPENESGSGDIINEVNDFFCEMLSKAEAFGIKKENICFDVGIGFGKSRKDDIELIKNAHLINSLGCALMYAASRKRVIGLLGEESDAKKRLGGTIAAHIAACMGGADIIRVHDVFETVQSMKVADRVMIYKEKNI